MKPKQPESIARHVPDLVVERIEIPIIGVSPLLMNRFSNKAQQQIAETQQGGVKIKKLPQNSEEDYLNSLHTLEGDPGSQDAIYGMPSIAFKKAVVETAIDHGWFKTQLRRAFFVDGEYVQIEFRDLHPVKHWTRVGGRAGKGVMMRYRGLFEKWRCKPSVTFDPLLVSLENLLHLFNRAGFSNGMGDWRPQRDGNYGQFKVASEMEWKQWEKHDSKKIQSA